MTFADLPAGVTVFLDANTIVYHFSRHTRIVAVMQANGLTNLASQDADFDRVPGIACYAPV